MCQDKKSPLKDSQRKSPLYLMMMDETPWLKIVKNLEHYVIKDIYFLPLGVKK